MSTGRRDPTAHHHDLAVGLDQHVLGRSEAPPQSTVRHAVAVEATGRGRPARRRRSPSRIQQDGGQDKREDAHRHAVQPPPPGRAREVAPRGVVVTHPGPVAGQSASMGFPPHSLSPAELASLLEAERKGGRLSRLPGRSRRPAARSAGRRHERHDRPRRAQRLRAALGRRRCRARTPSSCWWVGNGPSWTTACRETAPS